MTLKNFPQLINQLSPVAPQTFKIPKMYYVKYYLIFGRVYLNFILCAVIINN